jgi:hypothetical protein
VIDRALAFYASQPQVGPRDVAPRPRYGPQRGGVGPGKGAKQLRPSKPRPCARPGLPVLW